jgi:Spy/CpxP family protein refolding chaperone
MNRLLIPVMLLLGAAPAFAQTTDPAATQQAKQEMIGARLDAMGARLGLDAAGMTQFRATVERFASQTKPLRQDLFATRRSLKDELAKPQPNPATVTQLTDRLSTDRQQMQTLQTQKMAELRRELTPEQYAKLVMARGHFFGRHGHGHHGRGAGQGGGGGK